EVVEILEKYSATYLPDKVVRGIWQVMERYGRIVLRRLENGDLALHCPDGEMIPKLWRSRRVKPYLVRNADAETVVIRPEARGWIKRLLLQSGYPVNDEAGYEKGASLPISLNTGGHDAEGFSLRPYQVEAAAAFAQGSLVSGGGVIVLPCGAGKTTVGLAVMADLRCQTLILCPNTVALRQWIRELLDKTSLTRNEVGEYSADKKEIKPVTVSTYQMLTYGGRAESGKVKASEMPHLSLLTAQDWGLIVYDEVQLLPAPVFRTTAEIQARRRLGLTATLVREDGREGDVFSLIGPKRYDAAWKKLEAEGWIAAAACYEVRLSLDEEWHNVYLRTEDVRTRYRLAAENPAKMEVLNRLLERHSGDRVLIIGQYLTQLRAIARSVEASLLTGQVATSTRARLYEDFRSNRRNVLVVSKVANQAIDLPEANVAIQVSGSFGSRQEEAQRLGRILRPKKDGGAATFYSLVTRDTRDQALAAKRQRFLVEQGYRYTIVDGEDF
ncbi:MAG: DEAD/DEAH box helicase, partial [Chloroflexi bacterium]|nr:DEAD/DEAH box helicase [Chloroflexota bacterium]